MAWWHSRARAKPYELPKRAIAAEIKCHRRGTEVPGERWNAMRRRQAHDTQEGGKHKPGTLPGVQAGFAVVYFTFSEITLEEGVRTGYQPRGLGTLSERRAQRATL
jgi:hypothetical protein